MTARDFSPSTNGMDDFEDQLEAALNPVVPNPEFIYRLRRRLVTEPTVILERRSRSFSFVLFSVSLFIGALMIWIVRKLH